MRGDEAKEACPDIELVKVPNIREKADLSKYRDAGKEVAEVLQAHTPLLERASVDEAYLDITENVQTRLAEMNKVFFEACAICISLLGMKFNDLYCHLGFIH